MPGVKLIPRKWPSAHPPETSPPSGRGAPSAGPCDPELSRRLAPLAAALARESHAARVQDRAHAQPGSRANVGLPRSAAEPVLTVGPQREEERHREKRR